MQTRHTTALLAGALIAGSAAADTTQLGPSRYLVDTGVTFSLGNSGISSFLFNWSDAGGTFTDEADPTLVLVAGQTYIFQRTTSFHPFVICNDTLPVSGTDGNFTRDTTDGAVIDGATLQPIADFTADPAPTTDFISWTPAAGDVGTYYFTCRVLGHIGMAGKIEIVEADDPCLADTNGDGMLTPADFTAWIAAFNAMAPECDQNNDAACTPADFTAWIANFNAGC